VWLGVTSFAGSACHAVTLSAAKGLAVGDAACAAGANSHGEILRCAQNDSTQVVARKTVHAPVASPNVEGAWMAMVRVTILLGLAALAAAGCDRMGRDLGSFAPRSADAGGLDSGTGAAGEEVNPVHVAAARLAQTKGDGKPAAPAGTPTQPTRQTDYEARLGEVSLPGIPSRPPVLVDAGAGQGGPVLVNTVLAEVNGEVITREDILGPIRPQMEQWRREYDVEEFEARCREVIAMQLRQAVSQRLVLQEAKARLSKEEQDAVETSLGQTVKNLAAEAGSLLLLEERLKSQGSSLDEQREQERERLLVQRFLRDRIAPTVHVTHSELLDAYNAVRDQRYTLPTRARLGLITILKAQMPDAREARALADAVYAKAAAPGADFAQLAQRYSHGPMAAKGGDWGFMMPGSFRVKAVDEALFALKTGEVAPLIETDDAFHIVKSLEHQGGRIVPFTEVQDEIEDELRDRKYNQVVQDYIQGLYKRAYVRIMVENM
jgi:parvulin-like peptidyl-prolyl isomerase